MLPFPVLTILNIWGSPSIEDLCGISIYYLMSEEKSPAFLNYFKILLFPLKKDSLFTMLVYNLFLPMPVHSGIFPVILLTLKYFQIVPIIQTYELLEMLYT